MRETKRPKVEGRVPCRDHGEVVGETNPVFGAPHPTIRWCGDVKCAVCTRVYVCIERDDKRIYPGVPDDGFCACGSALFPGVGAVNPGVFAAQAMCPECAKIIWARQNPPDRLNA